MLFLIKEGRDCTSKKKKKKSYKSYTSRKGRIQERMYGYRSWRYWIDKDRDVKLEDFNDLEALPHDTYLIPW